MRATLVLSTNGSVVGFKLCAGLAQLDLPFDTGQGGTGRETVSYTFRPLLPPAYFGTPAAPMLYVICTTDNLFPAAFGVSRTY
ncbi:MAG: hypothetical protein VX955_10210, partial [Pseudomonadota bacterium]|nr:hypothetical protein [Pseudomonadota bacterium]